MTGRKIQNAELELGILAASASTTPEDRRQKSDPILTVLALKLAIAAWVRPIIACGAIRPQWPLPLIGSHRPRQNDTWWPLYGHSMVV